MPDPLNRESNNVRVLGTEMEEGLSTKARRRKWKGKITARLDIDKEKGNPWYKLRDRFKISFLGYLNLTGAFALG